MNWVAEQQAVEIELDIYAKFNGNGQYSSDRSSNQYMDVYKRGGSIVLGSDTYVGSTRRDHRSLWDVGLGRPQSRGGHCVYQG